MKETALQQYLETELIRRQRKNPNYSLRAYARDLGLAPGRLSELMTGKRKFTTSHWKIITENLMLAPEKALALRPQKTSVTKNGQDYKVLAEDQFRLIADWHYFAILSLMETVDFDGTPSFISKRLALSPFVVQMALQRLERLNMAKRTTTNGKEITWTTDVGDLATNTDVPSYAIRKSHIQKLERAVQTLRQNSVPVQERDFTAITMAIDPERLPEAKKMIKRFRRKLCEFLEGGPKTEVYELAIQLYPHTKRHLKKEKQK